MNISKFTQKSVEAVQNLSLIHIYRFVGSDAVQNTEPKLRRYLYRNSSIMMAISTIHLLMLGKEDVYKRQGHAVCKRKGKESLKNSVQLVSG